MHDDVLRCVELLNETRNFPLLVQIVNCVLMWCMMAVYLTMNFNGDAVNILVLFIVLTIETYGVCVLGSELSQKNVDLQRAIYDFPWYNVPVDMQKSLLQMLQRAQQPVGITAAGFCYVDIERFGKIVQTSYQIFVVMKDTL
ncbi:odorant receptor 67a-like [Ochlerotatus camptorhynchus]|uniref:odorant receptor 67a-like n=1 Tax=Ochlerotatus camptorhynchus TaxID=644619 RepID=UPI0031E31D18